MARVHDSPDIPASPGTESPHDRPVIDWFAVIGSAFAAGTIFLGLEIITRSLLGLDLPLGPAQIVVVEFLGLSPQGLTTATIVSSILFHYVLSLVTTVLLVIVIRPLRRLVATAVGIAWGAMLFTVNALSVVPLDLTIGLDLITLVTYMIYGGSAGWIYKRLART